MTDYVRNLGGEVDWEQYTQQGWDRNATQDYFTRFRDQVDRNRYTAYTDLFLDQDRTWKTKWAMSSDSRGVPGGTLDIYGLRNLDRYGRTQYTTGRRAYAGMFGRSNAGSHMANVTWGPAASSARDHVNQPTISALEVLDWEAYAKDPAYKAWLDATNKYEFRGVDDILEAEEWMHNRPTEDAIQDQIRRGIQEALRNWQGGEPGDDPTEGPSPERELDTEYRTADEIRAALPPLTSDTGEVPSLDDAMDDMLGEDRESADYLDQYIQRQRDTIAEQPPSTGLTPAERDESYYQDTKDFDTSVLDNLEELQKVQRGQYDRDIAQLDAATVREDIKSSGLKGVTKEFGDVERYSPSPDDDVATIQPITQPQTGFDSNQFDNLNLSKPTTSPLSVKAQQAKSKQLDRFVPEVGIGGMIGLPDGSWQTGHDYVNNQKIIPGSPKVEQNKPPVSKGYDVPDHALPTIGSPKTTAEGYQQQLDDGEAELRRMYGSIDQAMNYRLLDDSALGIRRRQSTAAKTGAKAAGTGQLGRDMRISTLNI
jgi:hypothetical protein